jgi:hypothetical protein
MFGQEEHIGPALPQRRDFQVKDVDAVVKVFPEGLLLDELFAL